MNFPYCKFSEFSNLNIFGIFQIENFWYSPIWEFLRFDIFSKTKIIKLQVFFDLENQNLARKISNLGIVRPFDIPHSIFNFQICFLFLYLLQLFEHSKSMLIHKIVNLRNYDNFPNCQILKISFFFEIEQFQKFNEYRN